MGNFPTRSFRGMCLELRLLKVSHYILPSDWKVNQLCTAPLRILWRKLGKAHALWYLKDSAIGWTSSAYVPTKADPFWSISNFRGEQSYSVRRRYHAFWGCLGRLPARSHICFGRVLVPNRDYILSRNSNLFFQHKVCVTKSVKTYSLI